MQSVDKQANQQEELVMDESWDAFKEAAEVVCLDQGENQCMSACEKMFL